MRTAPGHDTFANWCAVLCPFNASARHSGHFYPPLASRNSFGTRRRAVTQLVKATHASPSVTIGAQPVMRR